MKRPRIAVTCGHADVAVAEGMLPSYYVGDGYIRAVADAGGIPTIVPAVPGYEEFLGAELDGYDGVLLTGGTDIHPGMYGAEMDSALSHDPDASRDRFEVAVVEHARMRGLPILGICRGFQILNVAYGGSLRQHAPHQGSEQIANGGLRMERTRVQLRGESLVRRIVGVDVTTVYCLHHQALDILGNGLEAVGSSPDGIVEAIEDPVAGFVLGVLWHPEQMLKSSQSRAIYDALVRAAGVPA